MLYCNSLHTFVFMCGGSATLFFIVPEVEAEIWPTFQEITSNEFFTGIRRQPKNLSFLCVKFYHFSRAEHWVFFFFG